MVQLLTTAQKVSLYLLLVVIGFYAGMHVHHEMCPVETQLSPLEYAKYWKIVDDTFMHHRMGIFGPIMMGVFITTILLFLKNWKSLTFLFLLLSFVVFAFDVSLTVREQIPINLWIDKLDLSNMTAQQTKQLTDFQITSISNFKTRFIFSISSFIILCLTPFFLPRLNGDKK